MIIVSGRIFVEPGERDRFLASSRAAIVQARTTPGCRDFVVAADPVEADRVNVYEEWDSEAQMLAFRDAGPGDDLVSLIERAHVARHEVVSSGGA